jgi:hypothetical protein
MPVTLPPGSRRNPHDRTHARAQVSGQLRRTARSRRVGARKQVACEVAGA